MDAVSVLFQNREQAGWLLSRKLEDYKGPDTVVVGIPHGGMCVAAAVADALSLPLAVIPCRQIKHPDENNCSIGSITENEVYVKDDSLTVPEDYISHQTTLLRKALQYDHNFYYGNDSPISLANKTVILVDDMVQSGESIMACVRNGEQKPLKVIVAAPVVSAEAAHLIRTEADDLIFLRLERVIYSAKEHYAEFPKISKVQVKELLNRQKSSRPTNKAGHRF